MLTTNAHSARTTGISWSPSTANMLATCSLDRFYKRWTIETGKVVLDAAVDASFPLRDIAFAVCAPFLFFFFFWFWFCFTETRLAVDPRCGPCRAQPHRGGRRRHALRLGLADCAAG